MPPKRKQSTSGKASLQTVGTQTDTEVTDVIRHYQKQVEELKKELNEYKNKGVSNTVSIKIDSPKLGKGCTCKGRCSNRVCGCVKRGINCQEFCKCNDTQCENQEPKENVKQEELTQDGQKTLEKLGRLTLHQEHLHASEKKAKRSIFSPFDNHPTKGMNLENYPASPLAFTTRRRLFKQNSDDVVEFSNISDPETSSKENSKLDVSLNPMVPKHQLQRSPIINSETTVASTLTKRFSPPNKALAVAEVNWEEHQSQLVSCSKCSRKFFPHRIEAHMRSHLPKETK